MLYLIVYSTLLLSNLLSTNNNNKKNHEFLFLEKKNLLLFCIITIYRQLASLVIIILKYTASCLSILLLCNRHDDKLLDAYPNIKPSSVTCNMHYTRTVDVVYVFAYRNINMIIITISI